MAFTRYHDDPLRIMKQLQEFTGPGVYGLQVPGNGERMAFVADPQLRLQKWGANRHLNFVQVESELWGMQHRLTNRDCTPSGEVTSANPVQYPSDKSEVTAQPRTVTPSIDLVVRRAANSGRVWTSVLELVVSSEWSSRSIASAFSCRAISSPSAVATKSGSIKSAPWSMAKV